MGETFLDWLRPALTPNTVGSVLSAFAGAAVSVLFAFHRLMRGKASKDDLDAVKASISDVKAESQNGIADVKSEVKELGALVAKSTYDLAQALGSLNAVHRRLDEQGRMLQANTDATLEIARAVGARKDT